MCPSSQRPGRKGTTNLGCLMLLRQEGLATRALSASPLFILAALAQPTEARPCRAAATEVYSHTAAFCGGTSSCTHSSSPGLGAGPGTHQAGAAVHSAGSCMSEAGRPGFEFQP